MEKKGIINAILVVFLVIIVGIGIASSYAYFTNEVTGQESETNFRVQATNFNVNFLTSKYINMSGALPIDSSEISSKAEHTDFTVSVSNNSSVKYDIYLSNISISNNLKVADLKWQLLSNDIIINSGNFANIGETTDLQLNQNNIVLESGSNSYVFRIWIENTENDQSALLNGTFSGKIKISATNN